MTESTLIFRGLKVKKLGIFCDYFKGGIGDHVV